MLEKIVVGYAKDQAGRDAVALAGALAAVSGGRLTVVFPYHPLLARADAEAVQAQVADEVGEVLASTRAAGAGTEHAAGPSGAAEQAGPVFHWSSSPWPIHALHELAGYEGADLIVLGAAREDLGDRLHVSLMERMVHGAPCAVAVAPAGYADSVRSASEQSAARQSAAPRSAARGGLARIGVGFADSAEGRAAVELARGLAERSGGEVHVIAGAGLEPALASYAFSSPALADVEEEIYRQIEQQLERFCAEWQEGVPLQRETVRGEPAGVLIERSGGLDLLVLGSRAYGPLRHVLLGSVSARAMREARCPVLVVPRGVLAGDDHDREQHAGAAQSG
jgi:nucleotide-binding universal stress UspA family protein